MAGEILYSTSDATKAPIAVASIAGISKKDISASDFRIIFDLGGGGKRFWTYTTALARDTAYSHIITQYGYNTD